MTTRIEIPTLHTARLELRAFRADDLEDWAAIMADPEVRRFGASKDHSREASWAMMERSLGQWALRGYGMFAFTTEGRLAGWAGILHPLDWPELELAYALAPAFWGKGLASEAVEAARDWAFATIRPRRLASFIAPANQHSIRVAEQVGAVKEGLTELRGSKAEHWVHYPQGRGPVV